MQLRAAAISLQNSLVSAGVSAFGTYQTTWPLQAAYVVLALEHMLGSRRQYPDDIQLDQEGA